MSDVHTINRSAERIGGGIGGGLPLLALPLLIGAGIWAFTSADAHGAGYNALGAVLITLAALISGGFYSMQPNEAYVLTL
ncbi:MAG TPA: SPFH domain-containing protein, partial [Caulobacter sp.]|nr:SPFH domain-containing protein [Caulobacter sp.]